MRRPEGFDASPAATPEAAKQPKPAKAPKPAREPKPARAPKSTRRAQSARELAPDASQPERPAATPRRAPRRLPRPSASRVAEAELRAAERARKRAEKHELRRFTRRIRRRRIAWATAGGLLAALVVLSLTAVYSPLLALRDIRVEGTSSLDPAQLVDAVDGQLGTPLALLDEGKLRDALAQFTLIRSYSTEILPPGTLILHIVERTPVGVMVDGAAFDVVDAAGVVLATSPQRPAGLPLIGLATSEVDTPAFASISEVLLALPQSVRDQLDGISATTRDDVTLTLAGSTQRVVWGSARDSDHKARVLAALIAIHAGSGPGSYDVSAPGTAVFHAD